MTLGFYLGRPTRKPVDLTLTEMLELSGGVGWELARAAVQAWDPRHDGPPDPAPEDAEYRHTVMQSQVHRRLLARAVEQLDVYELARFYGHLSRRHLAAEMDARVARTMRTLLAAGIGALGLPCATPEGVRDDGSGRRRWASDDTSRKSLGGEPGGAAGPQRGAARAPAGRRGTRADGDRPRAPVPARGGGARKAAVAEHLGVDPRQLILTAGVDEAADLCILELGDPYTITPGFDGYGDRAAALNHRCRAFALTAEHTLPRELLDAVTAGRLVMLASPNNPTANAFAAQSLRALL